MQELALHILDIAENSLDAQSTFINISIIIEKDILYIELIDNGIGMSQEVLKQATNPYFTTKNKSAGMGLTLFKQVVENANGSFEIISEQKNGTTIKAKLNLNNDKTPKIGDLAKTMMVLVSEKECDYLFTYSVDGNKFILDTKEFKNRLGCGLDITTPKVLIFVREWIKENVKKINGGRIV